MNDGKPPSGEGPLVKALVRSLRDSRTPSTRSALQREILKVLETGNLSREQSPSLRALLPVLAIELEGELLEGAKRALETGRVDSEGALARELLRALSASTYDTKPSPHIAPTRASLQSELDSKTKENEHLNRLRALSASTYDTKPSPHIAPTRASLQSELDSKTKENERLNRRIEESEEERSSLQKQLQDLQTEEAKARRRREELAEYLERASSLREDAKQTLLKKEQRIFVRMTGALLTLPLIIVIFKSDALLLAASLSPLTVYLGTQGFRMGAVSGSGRRRKIDLSDLEALRGPEKGE